MAQAEPAGPPAQRAAGPAARALLVFFGFAAAALFVYRAALHGPFLSDDFGYIGTNPYTRSLEWANLRAIFDPFGAARLYTANYAPIHLLLTAIERQSFADDPFGYHVVNLLLHAANATLLSALLRASGLPGAGALVGGAVFLLHPANVEAVAWASQLKTDAALAFALGAVWLQPRRPLAAAALFALGLLTKASAAFAWPMACALAWARRGAGARREAAWLAVWGLLLCLYAVPEFASFASTGEAQSSAVEGVLERGRWIAAIGARYLWMAATSLGVGAYQQPAPPASWLDPWWLAALPVAALIAWRTVRTLRERRPEAAWWIAAGVSWLPISQLFPFLHPIADRYLYFVLPGLIGGVSLWLAERLAGAAGGRAAVASAAALAVLFAFHSAERARLWRDETFLMLDSARRYPDGATAHYLEGRRAALRGDAPAAVAALRAAWQRGFDRFMALERDPALAPVRDTPEFRSLIHDMAGAWIERAERRGQGTQAELRAVAHAHLARGEVALAADRLEQALAAGGLFDAVLRSELEAIRREPPAAAGPASAPDTR
jgi:hypothetical protein